MGIMVPLGEVWVQAERRPFSLSRSLSRSLLLSFSLSLLSLSVSRYASACDKSCPDRLAALAGNCGLECALLIRCSMSYSEPLEDATDWAGEGAS